MKAIIEGLPELTEQQQVTLGRDLLIAAYKDGIPVNGVKVRFKEERKDDG